MLSKLNDLENRVKSISSNQNQVLHSVNSQTSHLSNIINDMRKEQSWISPITISDIDTNMEKGEANVTFEWQIRELKDGSTVVFNYKYGNEEEYNTINAVEKVNGLFQATVPPIEIVLEPEFIVNLIESHRSGNVKNERAIQETKVEQAEYQPSLKYFVSVSHNDMVKSSDINTSIMNRMLPKPYGHIESHINIHDDKYNVFVVSISRSKPEELDPLTIEEVYLKKYKNGRLIGKEQLINGNEGITTGDNIIEFERKQLDQEVDFDKLVIKAIYTDGASFEREVYPKY
ncbi:hypothetical protein [Candidatus Syntrophocurvum alkaliphilum]|uniref:hypothetical protein n=1 Tax=Candidatus Syntrophocurvum alkaliphilum TaxID=2293317 RepID=UPI0012E13197|nr:hypothetical protein [Candidatus Syntrophocurvum alkaliphilum]